MLSDAFSEGQTRDITGGFPSDSHPYTDDYDYLSDSDLEDESPCSEGEGPQEDDDSDSQQRLEYTPDQKTSQTIVPDNPPPSLSLDEISETQQNDRSTSFPVGDSDIFIYSTHRSNDEPTRTGKVAIIRDMGAVTCVEYSLFLTDSPVLLVNRSFEAMLYFLYTEEIKFASFTSDPRHELPTQTRTGDWSTGGLPCPSAKSIYRLADKVACLAYAWYAPNSPILVRYAGPQGAS